MEKENCKKKDPVGVIIITHYDFGKELFFAAESIIGKQDKVEIIPLFSNDGLDTIKDKLKKAKERVEGEKGVIILTDMFGGTTCNACLPFIQDKKVEIVSGVNLPMLLKLFSLRSSKDLPELVIEICKTGKESVINTKKLFLERLDKKN